MTFSLGDNIQLCSVPCGHDTCNEGRGTPAQPPHAALGPRIGVGVPLTPHTVLQRLTQRADAAVEDWRYLIGAGSTEPGAAGKAELANRLQGELRAIVAELETEIGETE